MLINFDEEVPLNKFLKAKRDYSELLVHLTKDTPESNAKDTLSKILSEHTLLAKNPYCEFMYLLNTSDCETVRHQFNVVCFTETPLDQISLLLVKLPKRKYQPAPYGLVFTKEFIRQEGGNPVFYVTKSIAEPLKPLFESQKSQPNPEVCKLLALTTRCDKGNDWHWEREWRFVGNLEFKYKNVYCGLCPEDEIGFFRIKYSSITFIDPRWGYNRVLDELVKQGVSDDIPFELN